MEGRGVEYTRKKNSSLRMFKKAVQQGRSERGTEAYFPRYVEVPSDARTPLTAFFNIR
jgi:hypothetical protein